MNRYDLCPCGSGLKYKFCCEPADGQRRDTFKKLASAVVDLTGLYEIDETKTDKIGKWIRDPNPEAKAKVVEIANALDLNLDTLWAVIEDSKRPEKGSIYFNQYLDKISACRRKISDQPATPASQTPGR